MIDFAGAIAELYAFDAYGNAIGFDPSVALTEFLYSGEQFDSKIGQQYLRQRYYDPATGRFNRLDPFFGNLTAPQSLHKYLYTHADPVNMIDPNGLFGGVIGIGISMAIGMGNQSRGVAANLGVYYRIYNQFVQPLIDLKDAVIGIYNSTYAGYQFLTQEAGEYIYSAIMQSGVSIGMGGQKRFVYTIPKRKNVRSESELVVTVGGTADGNLQTGTISAAFAVSVEFRLKLPPSKRLLHANPILTLAGTGKYVLSNGTKNGWQNLRINASGALRWEYPLFENLNVFAEIGARGGADYSFQYGLTNHTASVFGRICKDVDFVQKKNILTSPSEMGEFQDKFKFSQRFTYFQFRYGTGQYVDDIF